MTRSLSCTNFLFFVCYIFELTLSRVMRSYASSLLVCSILGFCFFLSNSNNNVIIAIPASFPRWVLFICCYQSEAIGLHSFFLL